MPSGYHGGPDAISHSQLADWQEVRTTIADNAEAVLRAQRVDNSWALNLGARGQLDEVLERWRASLYQLGVNDPDLVARLSSEDRTPDSAILFLNHTGCGSFDALH